MKFFIVTLEIREGTFRVTVNDPDKIPQDVKVINYYLTQVLDLNNNYVNVVESLNALAVQLPISPTNIDNLNVVCSNALDKYSVNFKDYGAFIAQELCK